MSLADLFPVYLILEPHNMYACRIMITYSTVQVSHLGAFIIKIRFAGYIPLFSILVIMESVINMLWFDVMVKDAKATRV